MSLSPEEKKAVRDVIGVLLGPSSYANSPNPTEHTIKLVEEMILDMAECNRRINILLRSLPCAIVGRGFLRRCLKSVAKLVKNNQREFIGCRNFLMAFRRSPIEESAGGY
jgi:hypothetical protein